MEPFTASAIAVLIFTGFVQKVGEGTAERIYDLLAQSFDPADKEAVAAAVAAKQEAEQVEKTTLMVKAAIALKRAAELNQMISDELEKLSKEVRSTRSSVELLQTAETIGRAATSLAAAAEQMMRYDHNSRLTRPEASAQAASPWWDSPVEELPHFPVLSSNELYTSLVLPSEEPDSLPLKGKSQLKEPILSEVEKPILSYDLSENLFQQNKRQQRQGT